MRILVDLKSHLTDDPQIVQVEKSVELDAAGQVPINGKYAIPVPPGIDFAVNKDSYVLDGGVVDGGDVVSIAFAHLLAQYPQYGNIYYNPLLTAEHLDELDFDGTFVDRSGEEPVVFTARFQAGRPASDVTDVGQMPTHTALFPVNSGVTPSRPGLLITAPIDISAFTLNCDGDSVGADEFMVYWKLVGFDFSHDIAADFGAQAGINEPALRYLQEVDQEPDDFSAYISTDGGANWCQVGLLEPVAFCDRTKEIMLAFRNDGTSKIYMAHMAVLF